MIDGPVLVTGAAGAIGRAVVGRLLHDGRRVLGTDRDACPADLAVERWLAEHRSGILDVAAEAGTWRAETFVVPVVLAAAIVVAWRKSANVAAPVFLAVAVGGEKLIYFITSLVVGRDRPPVPTVGTTYATSSFPSGHVASVITLYGAIALVATATRSHRARVASLVAVAAMAAVVALCRMYTGFHYLSDCVAGALTAAVWLTATYRFVFAPWEGAWPPAVTAGTMVPAPLPEVRDAHGEAAGVRTGGGAPGGGGGGTGIGVSTDAHAGGRGTHR